jgi:hypothetical protein
MTPKDLHDFLKVRDAILKIITDGTKEAGSALREALISIGWTPPPEEKDPLK